LSCQHLSHHTCLVGSAASREAEHISTTAFARCHRECVAAAASVRAGRG
jgi:hypothetical protein